MANLKISQFVDGSTIQVTDEIATNRGGVNTKVFVQEGARRNVGLSIGDLIALIDDGSGNPVLPPADGSLLTGITLPTINASDVVYIPTSGSIITSGDVQGAIDELDAGKLDDITGLITAGANVTLTGSGTAGDPYQIAATVTSATAAEDVTYDNATSGLTATNVQDAIDEVVDDIEEIITPWVAYTPTFTGFGTVSSVSFFSRRVGDTLEVEGKWTAGTTTGTEARISLGFNGADGGLTIDSAKVPSGTSVAGVFTFGVVGQNSGYCLKEPSVGYMTFGAQNAAAIGSTKITGTGFGSGSATQTLKASFPIQGW